MSCYTNKECNYNFNIKTYGLCDLNKILINGIDRTALNWSEISVPEILNIPTQKPDIENIDQVYVDTDITSVKLIETPFSYDSYDILANGTDIAALEAILNNIDTNIIPALNGAGTGLLDLLNAVITAAATVLNNPLIVQLQGLITTLTNGVTTLVDTVTNGLTTLGTPNLTVKLLCTVVSAVTNALTLIEDLLNQLTDLLTEILAVPALQALLQTTIDAVTGAITGILTDITTELTSLLGFEDLCTNATTVIVKKANAEGTCLTGRKLIIEGSLNQKVVYTANVDVQSVHSADFTVPFSAFIIPYSKFENGVYTENVSVLIDNVVTTVNGFVFGPNPEIIPDLCEEFCVEACIEDIFAYALDERTIFKNITLFLYARAANQCS